MPSRYSREQRHQLREQFAGLYAEATARADVEDIELHQFNENYKTPQLPMGMQTHLPYLAYAHSFLLQRMLRGAAPKAYNSTWILIQCRVPHSCVHSKKK